MRVVGQEFCHCFLLIQCLPPNVSLYTQPLWHNEDLCTHITSFAFQVSCNTLVCMRNLNSCLAEGVLYFGGVFRDVHTDNRSFTVRNNCQFMYS